MEASRSSLRHVVVAGASGMIGRDLIRDLELDGVLVTQLVRRAPRHERERQWDPAQRELDHRLLDGADAVVNLAGSALNRVPWSYPVKKDILRSRVNATLTIAQAMGRAKQPPAQLVNASSAGVYGNRPGEALDESSAPAEDGFLPRLVERWEAAARQAPEGTKVALLRYGMVLGRGGAFTMLRMLTKLGVVQKLGEGEQRWPWVSLEDAVRATRFALDERMDGVINVTGPEPATADELLSSLATELKRPVVMQTPRGVIEFTLLDAGRELLLSDQHVVPSRLLQAGFIFRTSRAAEAVDLVKKSPEPDGGESLLT